MNNGQWIVVGSTVFELNDYDVNRWFANVQPGFDNDDRRVTPEECARVARLMQAAPALYDALKALYTDYKKFADSGDAGNWKLEDLPVGQQALAALRLIDNGER